MKLGYRGNSAPLTSQLESEVSHNLCWDGKWILHPLFTTAFYILFYIFSLWPSAVCFSASDNRAINIISWCSINRTQNPRTELLHNHLPLTTGEGGEESNMFLEEKRSSRSCPWFDGLVFFLPLKRKDIQKGTTKNKPTNHPSLLQKETWLQTFDFIHFLCHLNVPVYLLWRAEADRLQDLADASHTF